MVKVPPLISSIPNLPSLALIARRIISSSICDKLILSASLTQEQPTRDRSNRNTYIVIVSIDQLITLSSELTTGNFCRAITAALVNRDINPDLLHISP